MRILILGGTTEASALAKALAADTSFAPILSPILSLAGRTRTPALSPIPARRGGFGGPEGLAAYLGAEHIGALVDATHPFARIISANAVIAAAAAGIPRLALQRPEWRPAPGDRWIPVATMDHAAMAIGAAPRRVFLTVGQQELAPFRAAPQHDYLIRSVEPPPPEALPPRTRCIEARGPFSEPDEHRLLSEACIEVIVTKNSGGGATAPKLAAARALGLPVIIVARPPPPEPPVVATVEDAVAWLHHVARRGV